ncbi:hypothetical protein D3C78_1073630 [compost metagenome]
MRHCADLIRWIAYSSWIDCLDHEIVGCTIGQSERIILKHGCIYGCDCCPVTSMSLSLIHLVGDGSINTIPANSHMSIASCYRSNTWSSKWRPRQRDRSTRNFRQCISLECQLCARHLRCIRCTQITECHYTCSCGYSSRPGQRPSSRILLYHGDLGAVIPCLYVTVCIDKRHLRLLRELTATCCKCRNILH